MVWLHLNRQRVLIAVALVLAIIVGVALYNWKKNNDEAQANAALFALPSLIGVTGKSATPRAEDFQKVASDYPSSKAAERAELLAAGIMFTDGKYTDAQRQFSKFLEKYDGSDLQSQAAIGVAASLEAQGKIPEAVAKYQELIAKYPTENIISPAKLTLARLMETQNKPGEALKLYEDLARSKNQYDPFAGEARERRELLLEKNPSLKTKPSVSAANIASTNLPFAETPIATPPQKPSLLTNSVK